MRPIGERTQSIRVIKLFRIVDREGRITQERYCREFAVTYRTWIRDVNALRVALAPFGERLRRHGHSLRIVREDKGHKVAMRAKDIESLKTLAVGQAADLKIDTGEFRVWLNRVSNKVEFERLTDGRWEECGEDDA